MTKPKSKDTKELALLDDWKELNIYLMQVHVREAEVHHLLELEKKHKKRATVLNRVYANYARRRSERERSELNALAVKVR